MSDLQNQDNYLKMTSLVARIFCGLMQQPQPHSAELTQVFGIFNFSKPWRNAKQFQVKSVSSSSNQGYQSEARCFFVDFGWGRLGSKNVN